MIQKNCEFIDSKFVKICHEQVIPHNLLQLMQDKVNWSSNRISKDPTNSKTMILNFRTYGFIDSTIYENVKRCLKILTRQDYCSISVETGYDNTECEKSKINQNQPGNHLLRVPRPLKTMNTSPFPLRNRRTCLKNFFRHSEKHKN